MSPQDFATFFDLFSVLTAGFFSALTAAIGVLNSTPLATKPRTLATAITTTIQRSRSIGDLLSSVLWSFRLSSMKSFTSAEGRGQTANDKN